MHYIQTLNLYLRNITNRVKNDVKPQPSLVTPTIRGLVTIMVFPPPFAWRSKAGETSERVSAFRDIRFLGGNLLIVAGLETSASQDYPLHAR